ncbi:Arc family DNA-binding protein [Massilia sp. TS11]|uniref:Arc family DNA-binding protein n=1 Tax=Massilia sp. TS11 TaxID=2908003 RepID=UPI0027D9BD69|nr:Arc family DNA-binding protein [Massilia sp. TS11]
MENIPSRHYPRRMTKKPYPSETQERFIVRLPDGMRDNIAEAAKQNNRSMNAEIVARLDQSFAGTANDTIVATLAYRIAELELEARTISNDRLNFATVVALLAMHIEMNKPCDPADLKVFKDRAFEVMANGLRNLEEENAKAIEALRSSSHRMKELGLEFTSSDSNLLSPDFLIQRGDKSLVAAEAKTSKPRKKKS